MKKFIKFCGTAILALVVVGLIFFGIGMATVGWPGMAELVGKVSNGKISFETGIQITGEFIGDIGEFWNINAIFDIDDADMFDKNQETWKGNVKKTKVAEATVEKLNLELGGCEFTVKSSGDDSYYVEYTGKGKTQAFTKGNELFVKMINSNFSIGNAESTFVLYLPEDAFLKDANVDLGAGQMNLDNLKVKNMKIDLGAGQVDSKGLQAEEMKISVGAGEITLEEAKLQDAKVEVGAGKCVIKGEINGDLDAQCAMGNITLEIVGEEEDFDYEIKCVTGNITIGDEEYSGLAKEKEIDNGASKKIDLECAMGNIEVEFE